MEIFDKVGPLGEKIKSTGLKNPISSMSNIEAEIDDFAQAGQNLLGSLFGALGGGGSKLEYPLDVGGNPAYASTVTFTTMEYKSPFAGVSDKLHAKQQDDNLKQARLKGADDARNQAAGLGKVDDFGGMNTGFQQANDANAAFLGATNQPITFSADGAAANRISGGDDAAALNFMARKDTATEAAAVKGESKSANSGAVFFPKKGAPAITLYFPPSMSFLDGVGYENASLGQAGASVMAGLEGGMSGMDAAMSALKEEGKALLDTITGKEKTTPAAINAMKQSIAKVNSRYNPVPSLRNAVALVNRFTVNPNVRAVFQGVNIREFSFQFKLIPTSPEEADVIQKIIKHFRTELYPEGFPVSFGTSSVDLGYHFPNAFKIAFKFNGKINKKFPKIKECYLRTFSATTNSTGGGLRKDGQPNEIDITMAFVEHKTLTSADIKKGF